MICGGAEKTNGVSLIHSGFKSCLALSKRFDEMEKSSRPFDVKRDGFVLSEGSGVLVLEELEFARKRGAKIYGEILGSGMSNDSFDITKPSGIGALSAMQNAFNSVRNSKFSKNDINFIVAHGTSTVIGDKAETEALVDFFGEKSKEKMTFSTKGALGHTIGASGAIDLIIGVKALKEKKIPATKNLEKEIDLKIDFVKKESRKIATKCFLANSFGFGGYNSSIIVGNQFFHLQSKNFRFLTKQNHLRHY
ncbi:hypothetical protein MHBO_002266 [Bonamia ostreae]|uniref:beta-ketoacyl-[acyl-carrier-protein] synthase I n=1 Tax=Bonamia ostreae TaxID=126728 RepID=A0ABV2ALV8_9EUKA